MTKTMILIPGRTNEQGTSLNKGKFKPEYQTETSMLDINTDEMKCLGLEEGDQVRLSNEIGETIVTCRGKKPEDLPDGMLFIPYGPPTTNLMSSETYGSGMPDSKHMKVMIEKIAVR
ncbi:MAG: molybdopterin dinucleotide binding domain-containing protein [Gammaproteobacteria bacterium]